jgi:hypothetical protein
MAAYAPSMSAEEASRTHGNLHRAAMLADREGVKTLDKHG